jgi:hypothetical protein
MIMVLEDANDRDELRMMGAVGADTVVLFDVADFDYTAAAIRATTAPGLVIYRGAHGGGGTGGLQILGESPALLDCGYFGYHGPRIVINMYLSSRPNADSTEFVGLRIIPFALYVHAWDAADPEKLWIKCEAQLLSSFQEMHDSETGDYYEQRRTRTTTMALGKESGVVVLGKDTGVELQELLQVRDAIRAKGYHAELIKDLPEIPMMSNEEKVRLWTLASRFSVMVDRVPAGHLAEYVILREQRSILALLRQKGTGSSYMVGDDPLVDQNFVKLFEFGASPLELLPDVAEWAENVASARERAYGEAYPWRRKI